MNSALLFYCVMLAAAVSVCECSHAQDMTDRGNVLKRMSGVVVVDTYTLGVCNMLAVLMQDRSQLDLRTFGFQNKDEHVSFRQLFPSELGNSSLVHLSALDVDVLIALVMPGGRVMRLLTEFNNALQRTFGRRVPIAIIVHSSLDPSEHSTKDVVFIHSCSHDLCQRPTQLSHTGATQTECARQALMYSDIPGTIVHMHGDDFLSYCCATHDLPYDHAMLSLLKSQLVAGLNPPTPTRSQFSSIFHDNDTPKRQAWSKFAHSDSFFHYHLPTEHMVPATHLQKVTCCSADGELLFHSPLFDEGPATVFNITRSLGLSTTHTNLGNAHMPHAFTHKPYNAYNCDIRVSKPVFYFGSHTDENFAHWMVDTMSLIYNSLSGFHPRRVIETSQHPRCLFLFVGDWGSSLVLRVNEQSYNLSFVPGLDLASSLEGSAVPGHHMATVADVVMRTVPHLFDKVCVDPPAVEDEPRRILRRRVHKVFRESLFQDCQDGQCSASQEKCWHVWDTATTALYVEHQHTLMVFTFSRGDRLDDVIAAQLSANADRAPVPVSAADVAAALLDQHATQFRRECEVRAEGELPFSRDYILMRRFPLRYKKTPHREGDFQSRYLSLLSDHAHASLSWDDIRWSNLSFCFEHVYVGGDNWMHPRVLHAAEELSSKWVAMVDALLHQALAVGRLMASPDGASKFRVLWDTRVSAQYRKILNERGLLDQLRSHSSISLRVVDFGVATADDGMALARESEVYMGLLGAGVLNALFLKRRGVVVMFWPYNFAGDASETPWFDDISMGALALSDLTLVHVLLLPSQTMNRGDEYGAMADVEIPATLLDSVLSATLPLVGHSAEPHLRQFSFSIETGLVQLVDVDIEA